MKGVVSGVYTIKCSPTKKLYVGSSTDIYRRWALHKSALRNNRHHSPKLQKAWNKYGEDAFLFEIVEEVVGGFLLVYEQIYINKYKSFDNGYNSLNKAGNAYNLKKCKRSPSEIKSAREQARSLRIQRIRERRQKAKEKERIRKQEFELKMQKWRDWLWGELFNEGVIDEDFPRDDSKALVAKRLEHPKHSL